MIKKFLFQMDDPTKINIKEDINEQKVNEIISNLNSTNFFEDIDVELKNKTLILNLKEYPILNQLLIVGEPSKKLSEEIKKNLTLKEKSSFIKSYLVKDVDIIKKLYSSLKKILKWMIQKKPMYLCMVVKVIFYNF